jgi:hypothetical protein
MSAKYNSSLRNRGTRALLTNAILRAAAVSRIAVAVSAGLNTAAALRCSGERGPGDQLAQITAEDAVAVAPSLWRNVGCSPPISGAARAR